MYLNYSEKVWIYSYLIAKTLNTMISNKKWQELLALATTGQKLPNDAIEEEKKAYASLVRDYKIMLETAEEHGIKNPEMYIPFEVEGDFL